MKTNEKYDPSAPGFEPGALRCLPAAAASFQRLTPVAAGYWLQPDALPLSYAGLVPAPGFTPVLTGLIRISIRGIY